jgi:hypothetical protein
MEGAMKIKARQKAKSGASRSMRRRDVLRTLGVGAAAAVGASTAPVEPAAAEKDNKRKARYQPNSADVQNYYRVNRYPQN